jgi:uncharacterized phage protein gp47/JayE
MLPWLETVSGSQRPDGFVFSTTESTDYQRGLADERLAPAAAEYHGAAQMIGKALLSIMIWRWKVALWLQLHPAGFIISSLFR